MIEKVIHPAGVLIGGPAGGLLLQEALTSYSHVVRGNRSYKNREDTCARSAFVARSRENWGKVITGYLQSVTANSILGVLVKPNAEKVATPQSSG